MQPQKPLARIVPADKHHPHSGEPFLPLSWSVQEKLQHPVIQQVRLPLSQVEWLAFGDIPKGYTAEKLALWLHQHQEAHPFVIRGCHPLLLKPLEQKGGQTLITGREALLDLRQQHVQRKSLKELARRGRRHGQIQELKRPDLHSEDSEVAVFLQRVRDQYSAPLSYLYRTNLPDSERFWVLRGERIWGLISLIPTGSLCWHTELLIRDPEAPVGILEALIREIFLTLQAENQHYWSLGEVPFHPPTPPQNLKGLAINQIGRRVDFAYSASGLFHFKEKFHPLWRPVYLYGWPKLSWPTLVSMFWQSNCHRMVLGEIFKH